MNPTELEALINRHLDGVATEPEVAALSRQLEADEAARCLYLGLARLHASLAASESPESLVEMDSGGSVPADLVADRAGMHLPPPFALKSQPLFARRYALAAMLALGVLLGAVMTGVVLAYATPARPAPRTTVLRVAGGGFEAGTTLARGGPPAQVGQWQGDVCEVTGGAGAVRPRGGAGMLRFISVNPAGDTADTKPICSDLWQVVPLPTGHAGTLTVCVWFNADTGSRQARFHLMAMTGAGDASGAPAIWNDRFNESSDILASSRTMKFVDADPATWESAEVTLRVPANARTLIIGLAAYRLPNVRQAAQWLPAQFADDLTVTFTPDDEPR